VRSQVCRRAIGSPRRLRGAVPDVSARPSASYGRSSERLSVRWRYRCPSDPVFAICPLQLTFAICARQPIELVLCRRRTAIFDSGCIMPTGWKTASTMHKILLLQCSTPLSGLIAPHAQFSDALDYKRQISSRFCRRQKGGVRNFKGVGILGLNRGTRAAASSSDVMVAEAVNCVCNSVSLSVLVAAIAASLMSVVHRAWVRVDQPNRGDWPPSRAARP